jgi:hypothetical protein
MASGLLDLKVLRTGTGVWKRRPERRSGQKSTAWERANLGGGEGQPGTQKTPIKFLLRGSEYHQKLLSARTRFATYAELCTVVLDLRLSLILRNKVADVCHLGDPKNGAEARIDM